MTNRREEDTNGINNVNSQQENGSDTVKLHFWHKPWFWFIIIIFQPVLGIIGAGIGFYSRCNLLKPYPRKFKDSKVMFLCLFIFALISFSAQYEEDVESGEKQLAVDSTDRVFVDADNTNLENEDAEDIPYVPESTKSPEELEKEEKAKLAADKKAKKEAEKAAKEAEEREKKEKHDSLVNKAYSIFCSYSPILGYYVTDKSSTVSGFLQLMNSLTDRTVKGELNSTEDSMTLFINAKSTEDIYTLDNLVLNSVTFNGEILVNLIDERIHSLKGNINYSYSDGTTDYREFNDFDEAAEALSPITITATDDGIYSLFAINNTYCAARKNNKKNIAFIKLLDGFEYTSEYDNSKSVMLEFSVRNAKETDLYVDASNFTAVTVNGEKIKGGLGFHYSITDNEENYDRLQSSLISYGITRGYVEFEDCTLDDIRYVYYSEGYSSSVALGILFK